MEEKKGAGKTRRQFCELNMIGLLRLANMNEIGMTAEKNRKSLIQRALYRRQLRWKLGSLTYSHRLAGLVSSFALCSGSIAGENAAGYIKKQDIKQFMQSRWRH
jgi:hypothetical protein